MSIQTITWIVYLAFEIYIKGFLYPGILEKSGLIKGILFIFIFIFVIRYLMIIIYDFIKEDLFWIEKFKEKMEKGEEMAESSFFIKKIIKYKKLGNHTLFAILFCTEPLIMVLYFRKGIRAWNNIASIRLFFLYLGSTIICSILIAGLVDIAILVINKLIPVIKIFFYFNYMF